VASDGGKPSGPVGKVVGRNPIGRSAQESDEGVVPKNPPKAAAEVREGRPETAGNPVQPSAGDKGHPHIGINSGSSGNAVGMMPSNEVFHHG